ncbi:MAG: hypothetical protein AAF968_10050 [Pseudomonadota bacterium]
MAVLLVCTADDTQHPPPSVALDHALAIAPETAADEDAALAEREALSEAAPSEATVPEAATEAAPETPSEATTKPAVPSEARLVHRCQGCGALERPSRLLDRNHRRRGSRGRLRRVRRGRGYRKSGHCRR